MKHTRNWFMRWFFPTQEELAEFAIKELDEVRARNPRLSEPPFRGHPVICPRCNSNGPFHEGKAAMDVQYGMGQIRTEQSARVFGCLACQVQFFLFESDGIPRIVGFRLKEIAEREKADRLAEEHQDRVRVPRGHNDIPFGMRMPGGA